jgi:transcriptional regulator with XRE-family HTH domain
LVNYLGDRIKELREKYALSQKDISKNICSQAFISKIEKGNVFPSADILIKLADRLCIDISFLLDTSNTPRHEYTVETFSQIREAVSKRDYKLVREIIKAEKDNKLFSDNKLQQFFVWHEAICSYYEDKNFSRSLTYLDQALNLTSLDRKIHSEREIEILISKGNILTDNKKINEALNVYKDALEYLAYLPNIQNKFVPIRLYYNYSRALRDNEDFLESIKACQKGIRLTEKHSLLYLKGDLYFQIGLNYKLLNDYQNSLEHFNRSRMIYQLESNERMLNLVDVNLNELEASSTIR